MYTYFCIVSLCKFFDSNFLLCNTWTWCRMYWKWSSLLFVEQNYPKHSTFTTLMLYELQNMDHTRSSSRSSNWVPFSVLSGFISYNHSDDVVPAHLALILDVPGWWAILEKKNTVIIVVLGCVATAMATNRSFVGGVKLTAMKFDRSQFCSNTRI